MDSMEINKGVAAVLVAGIAFMVSGLISTGLVHQEKLQHSALAIGAPVATAAAAPAPEVPIAVLLASASPERGKADTMKVGCVACHTFNEGGKAGIGPNLYGVVGGPHAHMVGYDYSSALKSKQGPWTYDELNTWLTKPSAYAPGTKMTFAGLADEKERADIIDYLHSLAATPLPLPPVPAGAAPAAAKPPAAPAAAPAATPAKG